MNTNFKQCPVEGCNSLLEPFLRFDSEHKIVVKGEVCSDWSCGYEKELDWEEDKNAIKSSVDL